MGQPCAHCGQLHDAFTTTCPITGKRTGAFTLVNEDEALVGTVVGGRYHVRDVLGQGHTGTVFAVEHVQIGRRAALKVLRPRVATMELILRVFHGEARAAWSVAHPCLAETFDAGTLADGIPFFVAEHLEGETLAGKLARERMSLASAVDVMMQLLSLMDAVHARGLVLRDLRPQNLFLATRRGCRPVLKVLDFGLARLLPLERVREEWTAQRAIGGADGQGTLAIPYYLSPERTRGEHGVTATSDLFVATSIFYETLTGRRPFTSDAYDDLLVEIAQAHPTPLHEVRPELPQALSSLVSATLAANPRSRPPSAREMQDELRGIFDSVKRGAPLRTGASSGHSPPSPRREPGEIPRPPPSETTGTSSTFGSLASSVRPPSGAYEKRRTPLPKLGGAAEEGDYGDETETNRPYVALAHAASAATSEAPFTHDDPTSKGVDVEVALRMLQRRSLEETAEEETGKLTPELRARVEALIEPAKSVGRGTPSPSPPRLEPPPRRQR